MDEGAKCDLPYGHFGRSDYDPVNGEWKFERVLLGGESLQFLPDPADDQSAHGTLQISESSNTRREPPAVRHAKQIQALVRLFPEVQPASEILRPLLKVSEAAEDAAKEYDALRGALISFTEIRSTVSHHSVPIIAYASGQSGCDLRVVQVQFERRGGFDDQDSWLEVPKASGEAFTLTGIHGTIQQVRFATSLESSKTVLAVRLRNKIDIYQPTLTGAVSSDGTGTPLQLSHLCSISTVQLPRRLCADVALNPWFPQHVGIVDCDGNWLVYEFASRKLEHITRTWSTPNDPWLSEDPALTDGWARLAWVGNLETIVVCTRTTLRLFSIAGKHASTIQQLDVQAGGGGNTVWILDILAVPHYEDHFCVLTSQCIIVIQVLFDISLGTSCHTKCRIRHFRNPEDLSLQVTSWTDENALHLLLYSSNHPKASGFKVKLPSLDQLLAEDPLDLRPRVSTLAPVAPIRGLHIQPLQVFSKQSSSARRSVNGQNFYTITTLGTDHSLRQRLCHSSSVLDPCQPPQLGPSSIRDKKSKSSRIVKEKFVVEDAPDVSESLVQQSEPFARRTRRRPQGLAFGNNTINIECIANELGTSGNTMQDLEDVISDATDVLLQSVSTEMPPLRTLANFAQSEILATDVEHASNMLEEKLTRALRDAYLEPSSGGDDESLYYGLSNVDLPRITGLGQELHATSLSSVYDSLVSKWVSSLPAQVPGWVRLAKVDIIRRASAELVLASRMVHVQERKQKHAEEHSANPGESSSQTWNLPMRSSGIESMQTIPSSPPGFEQKQRNTALPTPSPTATPSVTTASSHPSTFAAPQLLRLSRYTTFTRPTPSVLPRSLSNVLSHWKQGEDLEEYDWLSTSRHITQRDDEVDEEMTEQERKRMQRRAERHIRRQRKEAAASQAQQLASSQAAEIFSASQPAAVKTASQPGGVAGSSQSQAPFVASQVVPGRFGARPPPKKKRKQGF